MIGIQIKDKKELKLSMRNKAESKISRPPLHAFLIPLLVLCSCTSKTVKAKKQVVVKKKEIYLPVKYYKDVIVKTVTPASKGEIIEVTGQLYSIFNNTNDTLYLMTVKSPELEKKTGYNFPYQKNSHYHRIGKGWMITTASSNANSLADIDSVYLTPGKAFLYFGGVADSKPDTDSIVFSIKVKLKRGHTFKDTLIVKKEALSGLGRWKEVH